MPNRSRTEILDLLVASMERGGNTVSVTSRTKPFVLRVTPPNAGTIKVTVFIWNCTHGGGSARSADEFRVQFTGALPVRAADGLTLILGWHDDYGVFAAWDIEFHDGQVSNSPSAQIKEEALLSARTSGFAVTQRKNGELAVAFVPELIFEYTLNSARLHSGQEIIPVCDLLNSLPDISDEDVDNIENEERKLVVSTIVRKFRATDFRRRVLSAYGHRCAACGVQLDLLDAAHIEPVGEPTSTDETSNGIALCAIHHRAYDRGLISFDRDFKILISTAKTKRLADNDLIGGIEKFREMLRAAILLPADKRDFPNPEYIDRGNICRLWEY